MKAKSSNLTLRVPNDTLQRAKILAKADGRSLNNYVVWALERRIAMTAPESDDVKRALAKIK